MEVVVNLLDIGLIVFILIELFISYKRGFIKMLINLFGYIAAAVLTYFLYQPFKSVLVNIIGMDKIISDFLLQRLKELGASSVGNIVSVADISAMQKLTLPNGIEVQLKNFLMSNAKGSATTVITVVSDFLVTIFSIVSLFLILLIVIKILSSMLNFVSKAPVIRTINGLFGCLLGLVKIYIILSIAALIAVFLLTLNDWKTLADLIEHSVIADIMINKNIFVLFLLDFINQYTV